MGSKKSKSLDPGNELSEVHLKKLEIMTKLSKSDIKKWYEKFRAESESGEFDRQSFPHFFKQLFPHVKEVDEFTQNVFDNFEEFLLASTLKSKCSFKDRLNWTFDFYDQDNTNSIDTNELKNILKNICKMKGLKKEAEEQAIKLLSTEYFKLFDLNNDGSISREEFIQVCSKNTIIREVLVPDYP